MGGGSTDSARERRSRALRIGVVAAIAAIGVALSLLAFVYARTAEELGVRRELRRSLVVPILKLRRALGNQDMVLEAFNAFYAASVSVDRSEFHRYAEPFLARYPQTKAIAWIPRVRGEDREAFEQRVRDEGIGDFQIREKDSAGALLPAARRPEYFPVEYVTPAAGNEARLGRDLGAEPIYRDAFSRILAGQARGASTGIAITGETTAELTLEIYYPIYAKDRPVDTAEARAEQLVGFLASVHDVDAIVRDALAEEDAGPEAPGIELSLIDHADADAPRLMYHFPPQAGTESVPEARGAAPGMFSISLDDGVTVADQSWSVVVSPAAGFAEARRGLQPWGVLAIGLIITVMLAHYISSMHRAEMRLRRSEERLREYSENLEHLVDERTAELAAKSDDLARHASLLEQTNANLEMRNQELDEFSYVASHDLQEPLRKMASFTDLLREDLEHGDRDAVRRDLETIASASRRLQTLVKDLLGLSRYGRQSLDMKRFPVARSVATALDSLELKVQETGATIEQGELPEVYGDETLLTQLFQNLVGNALKFCDKGAPHVVISATRDGAECTFAVADNGIGIAQEDCGKIFSPFKRLHGAAKFEGSGIGLSICRKIVERHDGRIWVESEPGKGATFKFTLPDREG